jgi:hypothetical protein
MRLFRTVHLPLELKAKVLTYRNICQNQPDRRRELSAALKLALKIGVSNLV